jgi:hypothetical protein
MTLAAARVRDSCNASSNVRPARLGSRQTSFKNGFRKWNRVEPDLIDNMVMAILSEMMFEANARADASNPAAASKYAYRRCGKCAWTEAPIIRLCAKQ